MITELLTFVLFLLSFFVNRLEEPKVSAENVEIFLPACLYITEFFYLLLAFFFFLLIFISMLFDYFPVFCALLLCITKKYIF